MAVDICLKKKLDEFNLDLTIKSSAKRIGILGPSGCGKSMTLKAIAGIEKPDSGSIEVDGRVLFDSDKGINLKPQQRSVGYLFQDYALFPTMTVADNIAAGVTGKGINVKYKVLEMMKDFELEGLENRFPSQLSGGQMQRVALARMMAHEPDVLLFDEPFSAMDVMLKQALRSELLKVLKKYDKSSIIVTHESEEAIQMCDYLVVMNQGQVLASGNTADLLKNPPSAEVAKILDCDNISRVEKVDEHTIMLPDMDGMTVTTSEVVDDDIRYAKIILMK